ncbi:hypothetical protein AGLY_012558 [Aphis glycines]|uniref:Uncharacterized protein n=1 Tax=Aphis glycines TaxID=307491 RepID=A0A6G0T9K7_APHGL|nr:hypothetical protein AGLY_012558 [Aphis glycines]
MVYDVVAIRLANNINSTYLILPIFIKSTTLLIDFFFYLIRPALFIKKRLKVKIIEMFIRRQNSLILANIYIIVGIWASQTLYHYSLQRDTILLYCILLKTGIVPSKLGIFINLFHESGRCIVKKVHLQRHRCQKQYQPNDVSDLHDATVERTSIGVDSDFSNTNFKQFLFYMFTDPINTALHDECVLNHERTFLFQRDQIFRHIESLFEMFLIVCSGLCIGPLNDFLQPTVVIGKNHSTSPSRERSFAWFSIYLN